VAFTVSIDSNESWALGKVLAQGLSLGSSLVRFITSYCRLNLQNDFKSLSAFLVVQRTEFKNLSQAENERSRFFEGVDVFFRLFQKNV
jgi:hypothetical protein